MHFKFSVLIFCESNTLTTVAKEIWLRVINGSKGALWFKKYINKTKMERSNTEDKFGFFIFPLQNAYWSAAYVSDLKSMKTQEVAFPAQEETFSQSVKLKASEHPSHLLIGMQIPVKVLIIHMSCSPPICLAPYGKSFLYVTKGGHNGPECYTSENL